MAKTFGFDEFESKGKSRAPLCAACEEMLTDALDGSLTEADQGWFDAHISTCASCSEMLADAQRGAAWLEMLKTPRPEPSARLVERILAQTTGVSWEIAQAADQPRMVPTAAPMVVPTAIPTNLLSFRPRGPRPSMWSHAIFEPRLAMTAAMAFFSVALTLNLTGVQLNQLHVSQLKPENLKHTYYEASAGAVRYYDNLRVVRVMESRVEDLREAAADNSRLPKEQPASKPQPNAPTGKPKEQSKPSPGVSRQETPAGKREFLGKDEPAAAISHHEQTVASLRKVERAGGLA